MLSCPRCFASWSPSRGCARCGYDPRLMINAPTPKQSSKFLRHGWSLVSSGTYLPVLPWNPHADPNVSHLASSLDLAQSIQWVASSGHIVAPVPGGPHGGKVSLYCYVGFTT